MLHSTLKTDSAKVRIFGLDVHQKTIVIAEASSFGEPKFLTTIDNTSAAAKAFFGPVKDSCDLVFTTYEAGGCGNGLHRLLTEMSIQNTIAAPSKLPRSPGAKVKNDKVDAIKLARLLRNQVLTGEKALHEVYVPEVVDEAIREKTRQRDAFKRQAKVTQNQIMGMLRRHGKRYSLTKTTWTKTYRLWLVRVDFGHAILNDTFRDYLDHLDFLEQQVAACDRRIDQICKDWNKGQVVKALAAFRGIKQLTGVNLVAELGTFTRFESAPQLMAYVGLTSTEFSSGESVTRGRITKTGNCRVRTLLVEAACSASRKPKPKAAFFASCPPGLPREVLEHAYKAQCRLYKKYWRMVQAGKHPNTAKIAVARELLGFIWYVGLVMESHLSTQDSEVANVA